MGNIDDESVELDGQGGDWPAWHAARWSGRVLSRSGWLALAFLGSLSHATAVDVLTYQYDLARTGQNLQETQLTPANVNTNTFGRLFAYSVDGFVYAQPLCLSGVVVPGQGSRNLVFVATEHDSVYAFDADDGGRDAGQPVWVATFTDPANGITSVPTSDVGVSEPSELGITGTPVIDPATGTLYVVTHTKEWVDGLATYPQRLHALDVATGQEKFGGPQLINPVAPGSGAGSNGSGYVTFDMVHDFQRPSLALVNGMVYVAFASAGDVGAYHGWVLGFDAHTLECTQVFNDTPNGSQGGIWQGGAAPSADAQGNLYVMTGNGSFEAAGPDLGDSFIKLSPQGTNLTALDSFTPYNQALLKAEDGDLGSGGPMLLPDSVGSPEHPHLLVGCGKEGTIYLVDRDHLSGYNPTDDAQIVQSLPHVIGGTWGNPAYFNGQVYYQGTRDALKSFSISNGQLSTSPTSSNAASVWGYPNGTPSISANGTNNAIVWLLQTDTFYAHAPAILHAYNATNLAQELYDSNQAGPRDQPGLAQKFTVPVVANGKVYVSSGYALVVYGNLTPLAITAPPTNAVAVPGSTVTLRVAADGAAPLQYQWQFGGSDLPGETDPVLTLSNTASAQTGSYTVTVSNGDGTPVSASADVLIVDPPVLSIGANLGIVIAGTSGVTYQLESAEGPGAPTGWQPVSTVTLPDAAAFPAPAQMSISDPSPSDTRRFYRVEALPVLPAGR